MTAFVTRPFLSSSMKKDTSKIFPFILLLPNQILTPLLARNLEETRQGEAEGEINELVEEEESDIWSSGTYH